MTTMWKGIVPWLFVINLGVAFGAGLYEARVVIPQWENTPLPEHGRTPALLAAAASLTIGLCYSAAQ